VPPAVEPVLFQSKPLMVGEWAAHEEFPIHPVGSKPKQVLICPAHIAEPFVIPGHSYLFKIAEGWRAQQIWSEILAYRIAALVGLNVPPCFMAVNERTGQVGALIEFFYGYPGETEPGRLVHAIDLMRRRGTGQERPHGARSNVLICRKLKIGQESEWWGRVLTFDALIGNTDRHTENWGVLAHLRRGQVPIFSFAPPFDNGTSLGYEIAQDRLQAACDPKSLEAYIGKGRHHCGWDAADDTRAPHTSLCDRFLTAYHEAGAGMRNVIRFDPVQIYDIANHYVQFDVDIPFTAERARFVAKLVEARRANLAEILGE
jgi:hypothetical protein